MSTHHATFSAFLRAPTSIVPRVGYQDVLLERRDGDDLLLVDAGRERDTRGVLATLAAVVSALPDEALHMAAEPVAALAPWSSPLPPHERVVMLREIAQTARAGSDLDDLAPLGQLLREWRSTAEVHATPRCCAVWSTPRWTPTSRPSRRLRERARRPRRGSTSRMGRRLTPKPRKSSRKEVINGY